MVKTHFRDGEDPLGVGHVFEDVIRQEPRQLGASLGGTRRAQLPLFAGKSDEHLVAARIAADTREARIPDAAIEVVSNGTVPRTLPGGRSSPRSARPMRA